jgi:hypothetical protein
MLLAIACFIFSPSESRAAEIECSVVDWRGQEISSATAADMVYLVAEVPMKRPKKIRFKTTIRYRSSEPRLYTISQTFNGHFYHEGDTNTEHHRIAIWIPDSLYIHDMAIMMIFPGIGKCSKTLTISH